MERSQEFSEVQSSSAELQRAQAKRRFSGRKLFCAAVQLAPRYRYVRRARLRACVERGERGQHHRDGAAAGARPALAPPPCGSATSAQRCAGLHGLAAPGEHDAGAAGGVPRADRRDQRGWLRAGDRQRGGRRRAAGARADGRGTIEVLVLTRLENLAFGAKAPSTSTAARSLPARRATPTPRRSGTNCGTSAACSCASRPSRTGRAGAPCARRLRRRDGGRKISAVGRAGPALLRAGARPPVGLVGGRRHRARRRRGPLPQRRRGRSARWTARCSTRGATRRRTRATSAARLAPTKWTRWAWPAYLGDGRTAEEALADPRVCPHAAPGALAGVGGVRTAVATALADTLHDEARRRRRRWRRPARPSTTSRSASHCGWPSTRARRSAVAALAEI